MNAFHNPYLAARSTTSCFKGADRRLHMIVNARGSTDNYSDLDIATRQDLQDSIASASAITTSPGNKAIDTFT